ncbi:hypothetical protein CLAIMM_07504 isoform 3 [Cladophialophora immunda]|nr:hypothetical protein CLAIMM_07504 isoform 3 [Cladophialophora immunda]
MATDIPMQDAATDDVISDDAQDPIHFLVAVDFGTTFSSVAYVGYSHGHQRRHLTMSQIDMVDAFPYWPHRNTVVQDAPTELWYPSPGQQPDGSKRYTDPQQESQVRTDMDVDKDREESSSDSDSDLDSNATSDKDHTPHPGVLPSVSTTSAPTPWLYWGYGVQHQVVKAGGQFDHSKRLARFKLLLDESESTRTVWAPLQETCRRLCMTGLINTETDLIAHYLEKLFRHTRDRLGRVGYTSESRVEFVLCVPAAWRGKACRRMHAAMKEAIYKSGFGRLQHDCVNNLFIVSEPEAAAAAVVKTEKAQLMVNETFVLVDAGGGTVDTITYTVDKETPLRLKTEEVELDGAPCGSSFINERFQDLITNRLREEDYLRKEGEDFSRVIDRLVVEFERVDKVALDDMFPDHIEKYYLKVHGLKKNKAKHFRSDLMRLDKDEIRSLFEPSLKAVAKLMEDQIQKTHAKGEVRVQKVILMGGFGQSKALHSHLAAVLRQNPAYRGITLICPQLMSTAVAKGAILRAARKEDGPARILQSSYGFLRSERYLEFQEHAGQTPVRDRADGLLYIDHTIEWMIHSVTNYPPVRNYTVADKLSQGKKIPPQQEFSRDVEYTFPISKGNLEIRETLYVADRTCRPPISASQSSEDEEGGGLNHDRESHYRFDHPKNSGECECPLCIHRADSLVSFLRRRTVEPDIFRRDAPEKHRICHNQAVGNPQQAPLLQSICEAGRNCGWT